MGVSITTKHYRGYDMGYMRFNILRERIAEYVPEKPTLGTISFLEQPDCDGKLTYRECRELLNDIKDMPDCGSYYGYIGLGVEHCMTLTTFKEMLKAAVKHRCQMKWS